MGNSFTFRGCIVLGLLVASANLLAQQEPIYAQQGGYGGGGFAGDPNQRPSDVFPIRQGEYINDAEPWQSKSMILTQGDRVEWKISGKKGQTVFATVSSDVFDPALSVVDKSGKELAMNDDQRDGDQSPFLTFYFPDDEEYKITVKNYRSTAGGKFMFFTRFIKPVNVAMGVQSQPCKDFADDKETREKYFRFTAQKGKIYTFETPYLAHNNNKQYLQFTRMVGPTGVLSADLKSYPYPSGNQIFEAKSDGDYYIGYGFYSAPNDVADIRSFVTCLGTTAITPVEKASTTKFHFDPHQFKIVTFPVVAGDLIQTTVTSTNGFMDYVQAPIPQDGRGRGEEQESFRSKGWLGFQPMLAGTGDILRLFGAKGDVTIVYYGTDKGTDLTMVNKVTLPELAQGVNQKTVDLGQSHFYILKARKGDNIKLSTSGSGIEPTLDMYRLDGYRTSYIDRVKHQFSQRLYFGEDTTYLLVLGAAGGGGSGSIKLDLLTAVPKPYAVDAIGYGDDSDEVMNTFSVKLEKGQMYQFLMEKSTGGLEIIDSNGTPIGHSTSSRFGNTVAYYFTPTVGGECRIRLLGANKETKFKMTKYAPPKIDGK